MRIGPIGSNAFADFYRFNPVNKIKPAAQDQNDLNVQESKGMDYLERQARNAQTQDLSFDQRNFDTSV